MRRTRHPVYFVKVALREGIKALAFLAARYSNSLLSAIPYGPTHAGLNVTHNCNCRCITCNAWKSRSTNELTTDELVDILQQLKDIGVLSVNFAGGEPLLRNDLSKIVKAASDQGFEKIALTTNGILLKRDLVLKLLANGLTDISISIDGVGETNDVIRGIKGLYRRNLKALRMLVQVRNQTCPYLNIEVLTTLMNPTLNQVKSIAHMCRNLRINFSLNLIDTAPLLFVGIDALNLMINDQVALNKAIDELHKVRKRFPYVFAPRQHHMSLEYARRYFNDRKRDDIPCFLGYQFIGISPYGDVYSGCWVLSPMGNLRSRRLKEIVYCKEYRRRLRDMFHKKCPGCACGYQSNLYYHFPSMFQEILWRLGIKG